MHTCSISDKVYHNFIQEVSRASFVLLFPEKFKYYATTSMRAPRCYCSLETKLYCSLVLFQLAMGEGWGSKIPCISTNLDIENMMNQLNQQSSLNYVLTKRTMCVAIMSFSLDWLSWRAGVQAVRPPREDFGRLPSGTHWNPTKPYITFPVFVIF